MSIIPPEGVPSPSPSPAKVEPAQGSGFRPAHVAGGGLAVIVGAVAVAIANHFGYQLSDADGVLVGGAALSAGAGIGHVIGQVGISGAAAFVWRGSRA